jgi:hypothetical protein
MGFSDDQLMTREAPDLRESTKGLSDEDLLRREGLAPPRAKPEPPDAGNFLTRAGAEMGRVEKAGHFKEGDETPVSRTLRAGQVQNDRATDKNQHAIHFAARFVPACLTQRFLERAA